MKSYVGKQVKVIDWHPCLVIGQIITITKEVKRNNRDDLGEELYCEELKNNILKYIYSSDVVVVERQLEFKF